MAIGRHFLLYSILSVLLLVLGACGDDEEPTAAPPVPTVTLPDPTATSMPTATADRDIQSPLSPISTPQFIAAAQPNATPDRPYLLFYSTRDDRLGWYLYDFADGSETWAPFQDIPGYRVANAIWVTDLQAFIVQMLQTSNGQNDLFLVDIAGEIVYPITQDFIEEGDAAFSAASGEFAFICVQNDLDVCKARSQGQGWTNLTNIRTREASPIWSPDGSEILFLSDASGITNLWLIGADGSDRRNLSGLTLGTELVVESSPSWSAANNLIVFQSMRDENLEIYVVAPDGTGLRRLTENPASDMDPVWSPAGDSVAFQSDRDGGTDIYVIDLAGGPAVNISNSPQAREINFIWSPDGSQLYFDSDEGGDHNIYVVNRDGSGKEVFISSPADDVDPQWVAP